MRTLFLHNWKVCSFFLFLPPETYIFDFRVKQDKPSPVPKYSERARRTLRSYPISCHQAFHGLWAIGWGFPGYLGTRGATGRHGTFIKVQDRMDTRIFHQNLRLGTMFHCRMWDGNDQTNHRWGIFLYFWEREKGQKMLEVKGVKIK